MGDELVAGAPQLVGVALAGELEGVGNRVAVDLGLGRSVGARGGGDGNRAILLRRRVKLLDNREEIAEELSVRYGCLCPSRNSFAS